MRGEVIDYAAGSGLISGEDGARYTFTDEQLARREGVAVGSKVDFLPEGGVATQIYPLAERARPSFESTNEDLSLWEYFRKCMRLYVQGDGRARRKEYWSFVLFSWLFAMLLIAVLAIFCAPFMGAADSERDSGAAIMIGLIAILGAVAFVVAFVPPHLALLSRRLHDIGMNGWFALLVLVPYLGGLFAFIVALIPSQERANAYGPYPKPRAPYAV